MSRSYYRARRAVGTALLAVLVLLPLVRIGGESALRFDVPTLRLLFFGTVVWMEDFFLVLVAVLALTFLTLFLTTAFGRIWCGWLCPQTVLVDLTPLLGHAPFGGIARRVQAYLGAAAVSMAVAISLIGYFVSPYEVIGVVNAGGTAAAVVAWSFSVLALLLFLDLLFLRRTFCRTVCPYAKLQGVLFDDRTLIVAFDPARAEECMRCAACVHACPVGIDIRKGTQMECIHCAECIDACSRRMSVCSRLSLVGYQYGIPGTATGGLRVSLYLTGGLTAASLLLFLYLTAVQTPFEASVAPLHAGSVQASFEGTLSNQYMLLLRNTGAADIDATLSVVSPAVPARVQPDRIHLPKGQDSVKVTLTITMTRLPVDGSSYLPLTLKVMQERTGKEVSKPLSFLLPSR